MYPKFAQKHVAVLMSTYNGEKYLREQLDSIYGQEGVIFDIYVRDDGSIDGTCGILQDYKEKYGLNWYKGTNVGYGDSFMELLYNAPDTDYYAFADQDDVWHADKLKRAVTNLEEQTKYKPFLYCANQNIVDEHMNFQQIRLNKEDVEDLSLSKTLLGNNIIGCSMVLNKPLRDIVSKTEYRPTTIAYHDEWVLMVAEIFGNIIFDSAPAFEYRRHSDNVTTSITNSRYSKVKLIREKFYNFLKSDVRERNWGKREQIAQDLLEVFDKEITGNIREEVQLIAQYKTSALNHMRLFFNVNFLRKSGDPLLVSWAKVILGYY